MQNGSTGGCERALPFHVGIPCHFFAAALKHIFLGRVRDDKILKVSALIRLLYQVAKESTFFPEKVYLGHVRVLGQGSALQLDARRLSTLI